MATTQQLTAAQKAQQAAHMNGQARALVLGTAVERMQQIFSKTVIVANENVLNIQPRNVGMIKGFFVDIEMEVTNDAVNIANLTEFGPANVVQQFVFTDLQNNTRINATGWFMHMLNTVRHQKPFGISNAFDTSPIAYGNNYDSISAPATIAASGAGTVKMRYYIPLAYGANDLRGALFAAVTNANAQLQITLNNSPFVAAGGDATLAVFSGNTGKTGNATVTVYQHYLDQLPTNQNGYVLPLQDLSTYYDLKTTSVNGMVADQDFPIPYANYRSFLSTSFIYDNGGTLNAGTDLSYLKLQSANFTDIFKMSPIELSLLNRVQIGTDYPKGVYHVSHRNRPLNTNQYGNLQLILNPLTVNANAIALVGYEAFAQISIISQAGSLPGVG